jgi:O-antigen ligase
MLTFSRGGFLALIVAFVVMLIRRPLHPIVLLVTVGALILAAQFAPESYNERISTLWSLIPGSETDLREDASFRGRLSERLAGWLMFQDHPLLGVGLNNYPVNYQDYSRQLGIDPRRENRSPDNLYVEIASEQGLLGLAAFGFILWGAFRAARQAQRDFNAAGLRDSAEIALAISVSLISYLISAMSKNSSYPDYFWLFIAIMLALPQVARNETNALKTQNADTIRISRTA